MGSNMPVTLRQEFRAQGKKANIHAEFSKFNSVFIITPHGTNLSVMTKTCKFFNKTRYLVANA